MNKESFNKLPAVRQKAEMMSYCMRKGIIIKLNVISNTKAKIDIIDKGTAKKGTIIYNIGKRIKPIEPKWWEAIELGYKYYYNKLNKENGSIRED
jgi:hypothetical protein